MTFVQPAGRSYTTVVGATKALRAAGFKPFGPRTWKRIKDHKLQTAEVEVKPSGKVKINFTEGSN